MEYSYTIWFRDGGSRNENVREKDLLEYSKRYSFDLDSLLTLSDIDFFEDGSIVGGIYRNEPEQLIF